MRAETRESAAAVAIPGRGAEAEAGPAPGAERPAPRPAPAGATDADIQRPDAAPADILIQNDEIGAVRMTLHASGDHVHVAVSAERGETADLFRRNAALLALELRDSGYASSSFAFDDRGRQARPPAGTATAAADAAGPVPAPPGGAGLRAPTRLDIRL
jgi:hypothetical protein